MTTPKFLKKVRRSARAKAEMEAGTKFLNRAIPSDMTANDLLGCLSIAIEKGWTRWSVERLHGIYSRRRMYEERAQLID